VVSPNAKHQPLTKAHRLSVIDWMSLEKWRRCRRFLWDASSPNSSELSKINQYEAKMWLRILAPSPFFFGKLTFGFFPTKSLPLVKVKKRKNTTSVESKVCREVEGHKDATTVQSMAQSLPDHQLK